MLNKIISFIKKKNDKVVKISLRHTEKYDYVYTEYYESGEVKNFYIYTNYGYGIKWYYQSDSSRCSYSFEDVLERLHRRLERNESEYVEEIV